MSTVAEEEYREAEAKTEGGLSWQQYRALLKQVATDKSEWAGLPVVMSDLPIVLEPRFPYAELANIGKPEARADDLKVVNCWFSSRLHGTVLVVALPNGHRTFSLQTNCQADKLIGTIGAAQAWSVETEHRALVKLGELVTHQAFRQYVLTGAFIETSKRTGIIYIFRKLRPTVAIRSDGDSLRILACLCMHPVGYYAGTWAGAMCPTDDVVAHLVSMRGDEPNFWKQSNQHHSSNPASGL